MNGFLVLFWKLSYVLVNTSANHNPGLRFIVLHGIDLNFNSIAFQVIRNFDFQNWGQSQNWANLLYSFEFRLGAFIDSR